VPVVLGFNYETTVQQPTNSPILHDIISTIIEHLSAFLSKFGLHISRNFSFQAYVKLLTQWLHLATSISYMVRIFWRSMDTYHVALTFDPMNLNMSCMLHSTLG